MSILGKIFFAQIFFAQNKNNGFLFFLIKSATFRKNFAASIKNNMDTLDIPLKSIFQKIVNFFVKIIRKCSP
jgi:hypothetical protein